MDKQKQKGLQRKKEEDIMATFAKPVNRTFEVSEKRMDAFNKQDTKPAFRAAMKRFREQGGKIHTSSK
ncbi:MAG: hypothetical protein [Bacteriophage sp.]|nr:MAG: hypothetical protein [Bacteriophage sp.]